jgi:hypothetical protein
MEQDNDELVAFIRPDAEDLLRMLTSQPGLTPGPRRQPNQMKMFGRTTTSGIGLTAPSDVTVFTPTSTGWAASSPTQTIQCWTWPTAITGEKNVEVTIVDGRFVATELC